jgi:hypothetical protein
MARPGLEAALSRPDALRHESAALPGKLER